MYAGSQQVIAKASDNPKFSSLIHRLQNGPESGGSTNTDAGWRAKYQRTADAARISVAVLDFVDQVTLLGHYI